MTPTQEADADETETRNALIVGDAGGPWYSEASGCVELAPGLAPVNGCGVAVCADALAAAISAAAHNGSRPRPASVRAITSQRSRNDRGHARLVRGRGGSGHQA